MAPFDQVSTDSQQTPDNEASLVATLGENQSCRVDLDRSSGLPRVAVVIDAQNIFRRIGHKYGRGARPAWTELLKKARVLGSITTAIAVVNSGFPAHGAAQFQRAGYSVVRADGADCDEWVIASLVRAAL